MKVYTMCRKSFPVSVKGIPSGVSFQVRLESRPGRLTAIISAPKDVETEDFPDPMNHVVRGKGEVVDFRATEIGWKAELGRLGYEILKEKTFREKKV